MRWAKTNKTSLQQDQTNMLLKNILSINWQCIVLKVLLNYHYSEMNFMIAFGVYASYIMQMFKSNENISSEITMCDLKIQVKNLAWIYHM